MILKASRKNIKIPSFTIIDMITGMVIMSIIISLVFYIFSSFNSQIQLYTISKSNIIALELLKVELDNQILHSEKIIEIPSGFIVINSAKKVRYKKIRESLLRTNNLVEENIHNDLIEIDLEMLNDQNRIVSKEERICGISLKIKVGSKDLNLYLYKEYSNQEKINFSILNEVK